VTFVVNTVQGETRRATAHVGKKSRVAVSPAVADSDAASAVIGKVFVVRIGAAVLHPRPDAVFAATIKRFPVPFADTAAAAQAVTSRQIAFLDEDGVAAVASTPIALPNSCARQTAASAGLLGLRGAALDNLQQSEALADDFDVCGHIVKGTPITMARA